MFLSCVREFGGCPVKLVTDLGTENGLAASVHTYFWEDIDPHRYVPSPRIKESNVGGHFTLELEALSGDTFSVSWRIMEFLIQVVKLTSNVYGIVFQKYFSKI